MKEYQQYTCLSAAWFRLVQLYVCLALLVIVLNLVLRLQSAPRTFSLVSIVLDYVTGQLVDGP